MRWKTFCQIVLLLIIAGIVGYMVIPRIGLERRRLSLKVGKSETAVSQEEQRKRKEIIDKWYQQLLSKEDKKNFPHLTKIAFEACFERLPLCCIEKEFELYQENPKQYHERILNLLKFINPRDPLGIL